MSFIISEFNKKKQHADTNLIDCYNLSYNLFHFIIQLILLHIFNNYIYIIYINLFLYLINVCFNLMKTKKINVPWNMQQSKKKKSHSWTFL